MPTYTSTATADNRILSAAAYQSNNDGAGTANDVGYLGVTYGNARFFVRFVLPASLGTITSVKVCLTPTSTSSYQYDLHKITQAGWTEMGSTWVKYDGTNNWSSSGGDYNATATATTAGFTALTVYKFDVTADGMTWGDTINYMLKKNTEGSGGSTQIFCREHATTGYRPYLEITYTDTPTDTSKMLLMF